MTPFALAISIPDPLAFALLGYAIAALTLCPIVHPISRAWLLHQARAWFASAAAPGVFSWADLGKALIEGFAGGAGAYPMLESIRDNIGTIVPDPKLGAALAGALTLLLLFLNRLRRGPAKKPATPTTGTPKP